LKGRLEALQDQKVFDLKRRQESELRDWVNADPARKAKYAAAWDEIAKAETLGRNLEIPDQYVSGSGAFSSEYFRIARELVRGADERTKPNADRLREFTDARLPAMTQRLFSNAPIYPDFEKVKLGWSLTKMREWLGTDNAFVKAVLGKQSPQQLADALVDGTKLGDVGVRKQLWDGGKAAVDASHDPFIELAKRIDPPARAVRKQVEDQVDSVIDKNAELIAQARFDKYGTSVYPDATFTQRFSFGTVKGWDEKGTWIKPFTDFAGAFAHATGAEPFALPQSWLDAKPHLNLAQHLDLVTTNDIIGGNSGSPLISRDGQIVGLIFDGNIHSLGGNYWYDERLNRAVSVDSGGILEALRTIYKADRLVREIESADK
ncbi:MAG: S46 family peptidase, partial [Rudaea sp.]